MVSLREAWQRCGRVKHSVVLAKSGTLQRRRGIVAHCALQVAHIPVASSAGEVRYGAMEWSAGLVVCVSVPRRDVG